MPKCLEFRRVLFRWGDRGGRWGRARIAFGRAAGGPCGEHGDLRGREPRLVLEARFGGQPRRHVSFGGDGGDQTRAFGGGGIGDEWEGGDAALAVAGYAARVEQRGDVVGERGRGGGVEQGEERREGHRAIVAQREGGCRLTDCFRLLCRSEERRVGK